MKKRKWLFLLTAVMAVSAFVLSSCSKGSDPYFGVSSPTTISVQGGVSQAVIAIDANVEWSITGAPGWCVPDVVRGKDSRTVKLAISANDTGGPRTAIIVAGSYLGQVTVTVNQAAQ